MDTQDNSASQHTSSVIINKGSLQRIRPWARRLRNPEKTNGADPDTILIELVRVLDGGIVPVRTWTMQDIVDSSVFAKEVMDLTAQYVTDSQQACLFSLHARDEEGQSVMDPYTLDIAPLSTYGAGPAPLTAVTSSTLDGATTFHVGAAAHAHEPAPPIHVDPAVPAIVSTLQLLQNHLAATQRMLIEERKGMADQLIKAHERALEFKDRELKSMEARYTELRASHDAVHQRELQALEDKRDSIVNGHANRANVELQAEQARLAHRERLEDKLVHVGAEMSRHLITQVIANIDPSQLADLVAQLGPTIMGGAMSGSGADDGKAN